MTEPSPQETPSPDVTNAILIVTGSHLRAEVADRPLAYELQSNIETWMQRHAQHIAALMDPLVCSDIWYINQTLLHTRPTISIGGPGVNGLSGYLTQQLTPALVQDGTQIIQLDPEFVDLRACIWGMNHKTTVEAVKSFTERYLESFLTAALNQVEPHVD